jgi:hypothetical protein
VNQDLQLVGGQRRDPHQTGIEGLQLRLRKRVEIDATNTLLRPRLLQPTEENLGSTRIRDRALAQPTFNLRITRRLTATAGCAVPRISRTDGTPRGFKMPVR